MQEQRATQEECWRCQADAEAVLVCPACAAIQPVPPAADLFSILGFPRQLAVDSAELERRYHAASRAVHPDRHQGASPRERDLALAASAAVNRAYRTLRDPVARGRYWLELAGVGMGTDTQQVPAALAAEVFETQETLEELRNTPEGPSREPICSAVSEQRDALARRLGALGDGLVAAYAGGEAPSPGELQRRLSEIAYLRTLLRDVERALGDQ